MDNTKHIHITNKALCTGCSACEQVCAHGAIHMRLDYEGFVYPVVNAKQCTECGLCNKICPQKVSLELPTQTDVYAAYNKNEDTRATSTSGGLFSIFSQWVIAQGGVVFGATFTDTWMVHHEVVTTDEACSRFRGSKYVQSDISGIYKRVKSYLLQDKWVLFSGTPCEIDGLKAYLRKEYEKLILIDLVCHGVPSPKLWSKFLDWTKRKHGILEYEGIRFRAKTKGWKNCNVELDYLSMQNNHKTLSWNWAEDIYTDLFERGISLRPSCYQCKYRCLHHPSDVTLGDCWHYKDLASEMYDDKGLSLVYVHTEKGKQLFNKLSMAFEYKRVDATVVAEQIANEAGYYSEGSGAREFYVLSSILQINVVAKFARRKSICERIKNKVRKIIG